MTERDRPAARPIPLRPARKCPICGRKSSQQAFPFCSKRCADVDLSRWLSAAYVIPAEDMDDEEQSHPAPDKGDKGL